MHLDTLENLIRDWGNEKGILPNPKATAQLAKTFEEVHELADAIRYKDVEEIKDAIGDIFVTLVMQTQAWGLTMNECVESAYNEIKGRTGKMINGQFVKEQK